MKNANIARTFNARLYQRGSVDAQPFGLAVEDGRLMIIDGQGQPLDEISDSDWQLKVGGAGGDRVMLEDTANKQTIVSDLELLDSLIHGSSSPYFTKTAKKLKRSNFLRRLQNNSTGIAFAIAVLLFIGFCTLGLGYAVTHPDAGKHHHSSEGEEGESSDEGGQSGDEKGKKEDIQVNDQQSDLAQAYMRVVSAKIKKHWHPPKSSIPYRCKILFTIEKNGDVGNISIQEASVDRNFDLLCTDTVAHIRRFPVPPKELKAPVQIDFTFDYKQYHNH